MNLDRIPRTFLITWFIFFFVVAACPARGSEQIDHASDLEEQITDRRKAAEFEEALDLAKKLLELRESLESTKPYELANAQRLVETIEFILGLPEQSRQKLAEADRLEDIIDEHWDHDEYEKGATVALEQLAIRRKILGDRHPDVSASLSYLG
ncbi:MAG: hypothetical protein GTO51_03215 [Candidatus Latescibacteria bacterium]|nr:hypothetical protein [Candidatus Latescibacterota bacterium]NIM22695.1 hypothetical protein [Candidatus Latescibacterota bacterium]NIM64984.1 hypothetical protein [Candidatus Latescibacterota bacterium]NIO01499.1 hypothetical protein [Candidatus Latescibacterota bacterium]NIO28008.1 hypothetical protein [Candidatus Latescibacterota bacterium]